MDLLFDTEVRKPDDIAILDKSYVENLKQNTLHIVFFSSTKPTLALGKRQKTCSFAENNNISIIRKLTNGQANYFHNEEVLFSIYVRGDMFKGIKQSAIQNSLVELIHLALRDLDIPTQIAVESSKHEYLPTQCFSAVSKGELVANGRKILGASLTRVSNNYIFHALMYVGKSYEKVYNFIEDDGLVRPISISEINPTVSKEQVIGAIRKRIKDEFDSL
jgi:lipoate-protein ligase A